MTSPAASPETLPLEAQAGARLQARGLTLSVAESSTGGLIAERLTDISGSSAYMIGGVMAYADSVKAQLLGVRDELLRAHGAVSAPVAQQMAEGIRTLLKTDLAISTTGITGPTGGTATKPVGLHFIGLSAAEGAWVRRYVFAGDRRSVRHAAADAALQLLLDYLDGKL
ncbi:MAG: nicotinamide-nucleotide amidohydrolase family protein [Anaerolineae bacterium]|nr:nicotinamide-nucleotide amidohydrolase family protein [Anaerolineae bacterium]